ncbi:hypothetical protein D3C81_1990980 [compost metagenome]
MDVGDAGRADSVLSEGGGGDQGRGGDRGEEDGFHCDYPFYAPTGSHHDDDAEIGPQCALRCNELVILRRFEADVA